MDSILTHIGAYALGLIVGVLTVAFFVGASRNDVPENPGYVVKAENLKANKMHEQAVVEGSAEVVYSEDYEDLYKLPTKEPIRRKDFIKHNKYNRYKKCK